jgi:hypothetical protein
MTQPVPRVVWTGAIETDTYRVVDQGPGSPTRLIVEIRGPADAMGGRGWNRFDPIPRHIFEQLLIAAKVIT